MEKRNENKANLSEKRRTVVDLRTAENLALQRQEELGSSKAGLGGNGMEDIGLEGVGLKRKVRMGAPSRYRVRWNGIVLRMLLPSRSQSKREKTLRYEGQFLASRDKLRVAVCYGDEGGSGRRLENVRYHARDGSRAGTKYLAMHSETVRRPIGARVATFCWCQRTQTRAGCTGHKFEIVFAVCSSQRVAVHPRVASRFGWFRCHMIGLVVGGGGILPLHGALHRVRPALDRQVEAGVDVWKHRFVMVSLLNVVLVYHCLRARLLLEIQGKYSQVQHEYSQVQLRYRAVPKGVPTVQAVQAVQQVQLEGGLRVEQGRKRDRDVVTVVRLVRLHSSSFRCKAGDKTDMIVRVFHTSQLGAQLEPQLEIQLRDQVGAETKLGSKLDVKSCITPRADIQLGPQLDAPTSSPNFA
ncbi:hypothetical protein K438DRAFT_1948792 [Mycena galopus ATCC 62051]|nr:hypothetical protein K438DRAFT_1948792 [Mycena galopus ATCC 62051]